MILRPFQPTRQRYVMGLLLCVLAVSSAGAQEAESTAPTAVPSAESRTLADFARPRRMVYFYETEPGSLSEVERFLLYNSILADVAAASQVVVLVESPDQEVPITRAGKEELALRVDADSWLNVYVAGGLYDLTVRAELYDMSAGREAGIVTVRPGFPVTPRTLATGFWSDVATTIEQEFEPLIIANEVTVRALPGTVLSELPEGPYEVSESGRIDLVLPTPATYRLRADLPGFVPVSESFYLAEVPRELDLVQQPTYRIGVDLGASSFQFPVARFRYHIVPGEWFARLGFVTQLVGINFVPNRPLLLPFEDSKLSALYLDGGTLFGGLDEFARVLLAGGGFLRLRHNPFGIEDEAALGGIHLSVGAELAPWRRTPVLRNLRLFVEYQPTYFLTDDPEGFLEQSLTWNAFPGGNVPLFFALPYGVLDLRDLHLGIRVTL